MKKAVVSLAAVLMVLASFATPSFAAGNTNYEGRNFRASIDGPEVVQAGSTFTARGTITVLSDGSGNSVRPVAWRLSNNLGQASRSGFRSIPVNRTKTVAKAYSVPDRLEAGTYQIDLLIQVDGETAHLTRLITVTK